MKKKINIIKTIVYCLLMLLIVKTGLYHYVINKVTSLLYYLIIPKEALYYEYFSKVRHYKFTRAVMHYRMGPYGLRFQHIDWYARMYHKRHYIRCDMKKYWAKYNHEYTQNIKKLQHQYALLKTKPENPITQFKVKAAGRGAAYKLFGKDFQLRRETIKSNQFRTQFYVEQYPETFLPNHIYDSVPSNYIEGRNIIESFSYGLKIPEYYNDFYSIAYVNFLCNWFIQVFFWIFDYSLILWYHADLLEAFNYINEIGFGGRPEYPKFWVLFARAIEENFPEIFEYLESFYLSFLSDQDVYNYEHGIIPDPDFEEYVFDEAPLICETNDEKKKDGTNPSAEPYDPNNRQ